MSKQKENLEKHVQDKQIGESNYRSKQNKVRETIKLPNYREVEKEDFKTLVCVKQWQIKSDSE